MAWSRNRQQHNLSERDLRILEALAAYHRLTAEQVRRLFFNHLANAQRKLKALCDAGLARHHEAARRSHLGRGINFYSLTKGGLEALNNGTGKNLMATLPDGCVNSFIFAEHLAALNDFRLGLEFACKETSLACEFTAEYCKERGEDGKWRPVLKEAVNDAGRTVHFHPDGVFSLKRGEHGALFFFEIDMGTEPISSRVHESAITRKFSLYRRYAEQLGFKRFEARFQQKFSGFRLLMVTSSEARLVNMRQACIELFGSVKAVWFATLDDARERPLERIWRVAKAGDETRYSLLEGPR